MGIMESTASGVIKIVSNEVVVGDCIKDLIVISDPVQPQVIIISDQFALDANNHEASSSKSNSKYKQLRCVVDGLTHLKEEITMTTHSGKKGARVGQAKGRVL
jgi:hypothetical protein